VVDLSSLSSVRSFASQYGQNDKIYALVCHAGIGSFHE
jgi:hypothetical protein